MAEPMGTISARSWQSFMIGDHLLAKFVAAIKQGDEIARKSGEIQSLEVFYEGLRQHIVIGRIMVVPPAVADNLEDFPLALLYGAVVREFGGEEVADLMTHKIGVSDFDEYSTADYQEIKDRLFKNQVTGKYDCIVMFLPAWTNPREYVMFKMVKDEAELSNLVRHLIFSCYFDPRLSSAFKTLTTDVDTEKVDVCDVTPKLQYPFLSESPFKFYPDLQKGDEATKTATARKPYATLNTKTAAVIVAEQLESGEQQVLAELSTEFEAKGENKTPGDFADSKSEGIKPMEDVGKTSIKEPEGIRNRPDYGEKGSYTSEANDAAKAASVKKIAKCPCGKSTLCPGCGKSVKTASCACGKNYCNCKKAKEEEVKVADTADNPANEKDGAGAILPKTDHKNKITAGGGGGSNGGAWESGTGGMLKTPGVTNDAEACARLKTMEASKKAKIASSLDGYCDGCDQLTASCICKKTAATRSQETSLKARKLKTAKEARLAKLRGVEKTADVPLEFESIWNEITEDFGPAPIVDVADTVNNSSESQSTESTSDWNTDYFADEEEEHHAEEEHHSEEVAARNQGDHEEEREDHEAEVEDHEEEETEHREDEESKHNKEAAKSIKAVTNPPTDESTSKRLEGDTSITDGKNLVEDHTGITLPPTTEPIKLAAEEKVAYPDPSSSRLPAGHEWEEDKGSPDGMTVFTCPCGAIYGVQEGEAPYFSEGTEQHTPEFNRRLREERRESQRFHASQEKKAFIPDPTTCQGCSSPLEQTRSGKPYCPLCNACPDCGCPDVEGDQHFDGCPSAKDTWGDPGYPEMEFPSLAPQEEKAASVLAGFLSDNPSPSDYTRHQLGDRCGECDGEGLKGGCPACGHHPKMNGPVGQPTGVVKSLRGSSFVVAEAEEDEPKIAAFTPIPTEKDPWGCKFCGKPTNGSAYCEKCSKKAEEEVKVAEAENAGLKEVLIKESSEDEPKIAAFTFFYPGQALQEFYPEIQGEIVDSEPNPAPNQANNPMINDFDVSDAGKYVSTAPSAMGVGIQGQPQVLDGPSLRNNEDDIRGIDFIDEFHGQLEEGIPSALLASCRLKKTANKTDDKNQFSEFMKLLVGEIAATFIAAFKVTSRPLMNMVPGKGKMSLEYVEQQSSGVSNNGSRIKALLAELTDSDLQEVINDSWAQAAVWHDDPKQGYVYEVFVRAESLDKDLLEFRYSFVTGTKEAIAVA
jgi:hypothetical protein